jgi:hypothetical protein
LLGLFGADDQFPTPEHVAELEQALIAHGKTYEFHTYDGAGHAFFSTDRPSYRPEAALDGWQRIFSWFDMYLTPTEAWIMCSYLTVPADVTGSAKGPDGWFFVTSASVYFHHRFHAHAPLEHSLNIDFVDSARGPSARVAVELSADSARELVRCIEAALDAAGPAAR